MLIAALIPLLLACPKIDEGGSKQDTTTIPQSVTTAPARGALDSVSGVPAVPRDSVSPATADSGNVQLFPATPRRGDVVFAYAEGVASSIPRCAWKGAPLPCYSHGTGVLAIIPLPADEPAGTFTLSIDRAGGPISRQVSVVDRDFGRDLIFLDSARYALLSRTRDIARDGRAVLSVLSSESPEQLWSGAWTDPVNVTKELAKGEGYGVERFYYRASDSSRSVRVSATARVRGSFGADTMATAAGDAPGWRHSGIDIAAPRRTFVVAPARGVVSDIGDYVLTGRTVVLDHGRGIHTAYFHLDTVLVHKGDVIAKGKNIARVGGTGLATGPHLHYGIYIHGKDVDPSAWRSMPRFVLSPGSDSTRRGTPR
jgi:murein DD-endopeptidase MepM/ murein hydrolase activator NlpD